MRIPSRSCYRFLMLLLVAGLATYLPASASPFDGAPTSGDVLHPVLHGAASVQHPTVLDWWQRGASRGLTSAVTAVKTDSFGFPLVIAILIAFVYGCIHAAGPGHGKSVIIGYFLSRNTSIKRGVALSISMAVTHVASAIAIVGAVALIMHQALPSLEDERTLRLISYGAIVFFGIILFVQTWRGNPFHSCACVDDRLGHAHEHASYRIDVTTRCLAVISGILPCTGSLLVLTYTIANQLYFQGLLLVCAIGAGMACMTSVLGISSRLLRHSLISDQMPSERRRRFTRGLAFAGPALVIITGATLFSISLHAV